MKKKFITGITMAVVLGVVSCKDSFLNQTPTSSLAPSTLATQKGVEGLLIGAYAAMTGEGTFYGGQSNWLLGSVTGGEANKGSNNGDQSDAQPISRFVTLPSNAYITQKWKYSYEGISRANQTIKSATIATDISEADKKRISGEARFLRGHYHFE